MNKGKATAILKSANHKFYSQFGFYIKDTNVSKVLDYLYTPKDSSSLAVTRVLFGLAMLFDIIGERGGAIMDKRWGDPNTCHFPLLPFLQPVLMPYMALVYAGLWLGAIGIMLGYKFKISSKLFVICYWYLFLIEKSYWNNHSYLFGLVAFLISCTDADCYWSIDSRKDPTKLKPTVPYWNYFILKYQFFILYFMAGLKKGTAEWLTGYSVQNLSEHWVFAPFQLFLTIPQIDYLVVHCFVFVFDLTVGVWMMCARTRSVAMFFCSLFHLMNSRLFSIGMFPWVCLATMPLFYPFDWPKTVLKKLEHLKYNIRFMACKRICEVINICCYLKKTNTINYNNKSEQEVKKTDEIIKSDVSKEIAIKGNNQVTKEFIESVKKQCQDINNDYDKKKDLKVTTVDNKKRITVYLIAFHVLTQLFLPYSHFITKGYNNWTDGLYGYSWDMMVHTWDTHAVIIKIVDNDNQNELYVDPYALSLNDRWTRHSDMAYQYTQCLKEKLTKTYGHKFRNISIYIDSWCSLNGRFTQRHYDYKADMLKVDWSPFQRPSYLMPLLDEALAWRSKLDEIREKVYSWSNNSHVMFLADFPGYEQEKFIPSELKNVTLTVLEGNVVYEPETTQHFTGHSYKLDTGDITDINSGAFHKIINIGDNPAYYMYTYYNTTEDVKEVDKPLLPIAQELFDKFVKMAVFGKVVGVSLWQIAFKWATCACSSGAIA